MCRKEADQYFYIRTKQTFFYLPVNRTVSTQHTSQFTLGISFMASLSSSFQTKSKLETDYLIIIRLYAIN